ncbi:hypothetical protein GCM10022251_31410 [Phytohabitans flavus]|uniref:PBP domain-containing protein n=1 Tax=Phytohabitans flavus TaxID=1076124 RepID=A0A6F8XWN9_9ACTN|nr:hypothetical protein Pflav_046740 [Phytohabitans flavus]
MRVSPMYRRVGAAVTVITMCGGLLALPSAPAQADPTEVRQLAGVGSFTTQDVMNSLASTITLNGQKPLASYDTSGSSTITTKNSATCTMARPATDMAGEQALSNSRQLGNGCLDFARLSAEPIHTPVGPSPDLAYLPFARDAMSFLVSSSMSRRLSTADLRAIYTCQRPEFHPYLPATGSQLRTDWLRTIGLYSYDKAQYPCVKDTLPGNAPLRDNLGVVVGLFDSQGIVPFSMAQYIAQSLGRVNSTVTASMGLGVITDQSSGAAPLVANTTDYPSGLSYIGFGNNAPKDLTPTRLRAIYTCVDSLVTNGSLTPRMPGPGTIRTAFLAQLGISEADVDRGAYPCLGQWDRNSQLPVNSIAPYPIADYIGELVGLQRDIHKSASLGRIGNYNPYKINASYGAMLVHNVYNAIPVSKTTQSPWKEVFVGPSSLICAQTPTIQWYGFLPMDGGCGVGTPETTLQPQAGGMGPDTVIRPMASGESVTIQHGKCRITGWYTNASRYVAVQGIVLAGQRCWIRVSLSGINYEHRIPWAFDMQYWYYASWLPIPTPDGSHDYRFFWPSLQGGTYTLKTGNMVDYAIFQVTDLDVQPYGYTAGASWGPGNPGMAPANWCDRWNAPGAPPGCTGT